jgi:hypothetical protein
MRKEFITEIEREFVMGILLLHSLSTAYTTRKLTGNEPRNQETLELQCEVNYSELKYYNSDVICCNYRLYLNIQVTAQARPVL